VTDAEHLQRTFQNTVALHERVAADSAGAILRAADVLRAALTAGHKILAFGNGGSATDAQHLSSELVGRFGRHITRPGLPAIALSADTAIVTAVANDFGYTAVFARQVEALGSAGDVAVAFTTSGSSANVNEGLRWALDRSLTTIALTGGDGGESGRLADVHINVPDADPARVQEVHRTILHAICELIERAPLMRPTASV
jgi:D-sedoheptulose 7-phosphate isomerase